MSWFTNLFSSPTPPPSLEGCHFEIERAPPRSACNRWLSRIVFFPFSLPERIYNTYLLFKYGELRQPAKENMCPLRVINPLRTLFFTFNMTAVPEFMKAILRHPRKDPDTGLFNDQENKQVFLLLARELFPNEKIEENDSLFTCSKEELLLHRTPVLQFLTPSNIKRQSGELVGVAGDVMKLYCGDEKVNATEMSFTFTTTVISRLLLGHPGPIEKYKEISSSLDCLNRIAIKKAWHQNLSREENDSYNQALEVVREAIATSITNEQRPPLGSLVEALEGKMSPIQVKVALFNLFFAGSETAAALLSYVFWQLGQHPEYQEAIHREISGGGDLFQLAEASPTLNKVFAESIRLFTPGYLISRRAAADLICRAKDRQGKVVFEQKINQGEGLTSLPTFAARDPLKFPNPDQFDPSRFSQPPKALDWRPFGDGAHSCPGQTLAKSEVLVLIASIVRQFTFTSSPKNEIGQKGLLTLKPAEDVSLLITRR